MAEVTKGKWALVMLNQIKHLIARLQNTKDRLLKMPVIQLIYRTTESAGSHNASHMAAGVSYYAILSIFPLLLGLVAVFGFFLPSVNLQNDLLDFFSRNLPGSADILKQNVANIVRLRGILGIVSIVVLFWSGSTMFSAISLVINRAWGIVRYRKFLIRKAGELAMAVSTGIMFILSLGASVI